MGDAAKKVGDQEQASPKTWPDWMLTDVAAEYCDMSANALRKHIALGHIVPDSRAGRGRFKSHRFRRETLDRFLANDNGQK